MNLRSLIPRLPRLAWVILTGAAILRLAYLLLYSSLPEFRQLTVDANFHHHWASHIAGGDIAGDTTFFRAPFYIYMLAFLYWLFGASLWAGRIFGLLIGVASVGMTFVIGRRLFGERSGMIGMLLHALYPIAIYFEPELLVEPLFLLLVQLSIDRLIVWQQSGEIAPAFWFSIAAGLASITRPTGLLLFAAALLVLLLQRRTLKQPLVHIAVLIVGGIITIGPVSLRNLAVADDPTLIASSGGINLYIGNNDEADGVSAVLPPPLGPNWRLQQIKFVAEDVTGSDMVWGEVSTYWTKQAIDWMADNPGRFFGLYLSKLYWYLSADLISNNRELPPFFDRVGLLGWNPVRFWLVLPLAVVGLIAGGWSRREIRPVLVFGALYILAGALFFYATRFRYPLLPIFFVLAGYGTVQLFEQWRTDRRRMAILIALGFAISVFSVLSLAPLPQDESTHALTERGIFEYSRGNYEAAVQYQRAAISTDPDYPGLHSNLGASFLELSQSNVQATPFQKGLWLDSAATHFRRELQLHPWYTNALSNLALVYLLQEAYGRAAALSRQAIEQAPYDYSPNIILLRAMYADSTVNDTELAIEALAAARRTDNYIFLLNDAAELLLLHRLADQAEDLYERALRAEPPPIETDDQAFRHNFRHSQPIIGSQRAKAAVMVGRIAASRMNFDRVIELARTALEHDPSTAEAWGLLYRGYRATGQGGRAEQVRQEAMRRFPGNAQLHQLLTP